MALIHQYLSISYALSLLTVFWEISGFIHQIVFWNSFCLEVSNHGFQNLHRMTLSILPSNFPMDTSSSIRHRFHIEIPRGKFVDISSILKGKSTWKLWHRFNMENSTWIRLSKSIKYWWVFHVDFSMSFWRQIDVTSVVATISILSLSVLATYSKANLV